jgi:transposase
MTRKKAYRVVDAKHTVESVRPFCHKHLEAGERLICIDEAGFHVGDHGRRGYAFRGKRLNVIGMKLQRRKYTLIMAVSAAGIVKYEILDHNCKKPDLVRFMQELQAPSGTTLLMDNLKAHHSKEVGAAMQEKGFTPLFIPTYSPKFNAIENCFGTIKSLFRRRCPPVPNIQTDYKELMRQVLNEFQTRNLEACFMHAAAHSELVLSSLDGATTVLGYDVT